MDNKYYTDSYYEAIELGSLDEYAKKHGEEIHHNGTHTLISYVTEKANIFLNLDFQDDYRTPTFHVRDEDSLEPFDNFEDALSVFEDWIKEFDHQQNKIQNGEIKMNQTDLKKEYKELQNKYNVEVYENKIRKAINAAIKDGLSVEQILQYTIDDTEEHMKCWEGDTAFLNDVYIPSLARILYTEYYTESK